MKRLIICGNCETESKTSINKWVGRGYGIEVRRIPFVLGELNDQNQVVIKREHKGYTIVDGRDFTISCERCGNPVFMKHVEDINYVFQTRSMAGTVTGTVGALI